MDIRYYVTAAVRTILLARNEFQGVNPQQRVVDVPNEWGLYLVEYTTDYELRKATLRFSRTSPGASIPQDAAMCTFHLLNLTGGVPDATWNDTDYNNAEAALGNMWSALGTRYAPEVRLVDIEWRADGPAFKPFGSALQPTLRVSLIDLPGAANGENSLPPQCAISVTEVTAARYTVHGVGVPGDAVGTGRTQSRNRWGRFYLPEPTINTVVNGRIGAGTSAQVAEAVATAYRALIADDLIPVMYSPTTGHAWSVDAIHVDDIFDVIRSRRFDGPLTRNVEEIPGS